MATKGAIPLNESQLVYEAQKRVPDLTEGQVRKVLSALKDEIVDCVTQGYKVNLTGLVAFEPTVKAGRKKGTVVRNPFDGTTKTLRSDEPDKFVLKIKRSSVVSGKFPKVTTSDGKELLRQLTGRRIK